MARTLGGGDQGNFLDITCVPDSTFETEIAALIAAGSNPNDKLVTFTYSDNYEVTSAADGATPDGIVLNYEKHNTYGYLLTVRVFGYTDQNGTWHNANCIITIPYEGTIAL